MNGFKIRHALPEDLSEMLRIFSSAREYMARTGNPNQWGPRAWPPEVLLRRDIEQGGSYVCCRDGKTVGTFFLRYGTCPEPAYNRIEKGTWHWSGPYGVVHRIAGDGSVPGIGTACLTWALEQCGHLRIDTHEDNRVMRNLLGKLGFSRCGIVFTAEDGTPRIAFDRCTLPRAL